MNMQSLRKKTLLLFTTFALIMACVPSVATPVPVAPLDPNAINTFIVQTAEAASTQTAAAMPIFTSTATITVTPPSSFTPESTFTPVGVIIFPTSTPFEEQQYFRVKHDSQLAFQNYKSRTADPAWPVDRWGLQTPEVFRMSVGLDRSIGTHRTKLTGVWETFIDQLNNNNEKKLNYLKANDTALFDHAGFPQLESLTMGGNIITLDEIRDGWGRVHTLDYGNPGSLEEINYTTQPDLVHKFVVVGWKRSSKKTYWVNPPPGDLYWPLVSSRAVWMPLEFLEAFPQLPMTVTADVALEIRTAPSKNSDLTGSKISKGGVANVVEYYPSASDVWGRLSSGGWIPLLAHQKGLPRYPTSWEMETQPPIPPYNNP
jgi:hypothetical protein